MKFKKKLILSSIAIALFSAIGTHAAEQKFLWKDNSKIAAMIENAPLIISNNPKHYLSLEKNVSLKVKNIYTDNNNDSTTRYQQLYKNIPVAGDDTIISRYADGSFKHVHGAIVTGIASDLSDVIPTISETQAIRIAKAHHDIEPSHSNLLIWLDSNSNARLTYQVNYAASSNESIIIDAINGDIVETVIRVSLLLTQIGHRRKLFATKTL